MKRNEAKFTLATIFLALTVVVVSAARGVDGASPDPNAVHRSAAGEYANYIADAVEQQHATPAPGFASYLDDELQSVSATSAGADFGKDACDVKMYDNCGSDCSSRMWFGAEYLMLWTKGRALPPLITTGDPGEDGVLGLGSTTILYGGEEVGEDFRSSGRFSLGFWLDDCERLGLGGRFLISETEESNFAAASNPNGSPVLARPFFNSDLIAGLQDSLIISQPGIRRGDIAAMSDSDLMSLDAYFRVLLYQCGNRRLDLLAGYQFSRIDDSLSINHRMVQLAGDFPPGTQFAFQDAFDVKNSFHGAVLGLQGEYTRGGLTMAMTSKLGFGNMRQEVSIDGSSTVIDSTGNRADFVGGLLALPTNIGSYRSDEFAVVPEVEVKLMYRVSSRLDVSLGYSFLYWTNVALAGDQIDTSVQNTPTVDASQLLGGMLAPGAPGNPVFNGIDDAGYWAQGLSFGVTFKH